MLSSTHRRVKSDDFKYYNIDESIDFNNKDKGIISKTNNKFFTICSLLLVISQIFIVIYLYTNGTTLIEEGHETLNNLNEFIDEGRNTLNKIDSNSQLTMGNIQEDIKLVINNFNELMDNMYIKMNKTLTTVNIELNKLNNIENNI